MLGGSITDSIVATGGEESYFGGGAASKLIFAMLVVVFLIFIGALYFNIMFAVEFNRGIQAMYATGFSLQVPRKREGYGKLKEGYGSIKEGLRREGYTSAEMQKMIANRARAAMIGTPYFINRLTTKKEGMRGDPSGIADGFGQIQLGSGRSTIMGKQERKVFDKRNPALMSMLSPVSSAGAML